ncbi:hypothetical protein TSUD_356160 [Trifolium subterraneum]|uniref:Malectin-like domain-containing protein n=1 Tax=Trifolium subterraneum TaxID=3900 RepID=A0A2Z6LZN9_TRISU|nr:hypothetical protein TSUD_356160 [Trifolium subterraneum]
MMRMLLPFLLVLLGVFAILVSIQAQDQSGFISLDCGQHEDVSYSSLETGINYMSDAKFIDTDTSVSKMLQPIGNDTLLQELEYVRSFPNGVRNCYRINVTSGTKYLIRASFYYGNYDDLSDPPQFDLHFGANLWDTVKLLSNESYIITREIIYTTSQDYIQPCLVNTGSGIPFISAIELRPLNNSNYVTYYSPKSVLSTFLRYDLGNTDLYYRYQADVYDRIWEPYELSSDWRQLSISLNNDELVQNDYKPAAIVMSTAVTPVNESAPLQFHWDADNVNDKYYIYMHFTEVEKLAGNETRAFNITLNGDFFYGPVVPKYREAHTVYSTSSKTGSKRYRLSLFKTENSTLPPILNAIEIYKVLDFSQSETLQDDGKFFFEARMMVN